MSTVKVNCWFCGEHSTITIEEKDGWTCESCQQYNGFTEDGDYNRPIRSQYDVKDYKTKTVCSPSAFHTAKSVLCDSCSQNQVLKVRQLAAFTPFNEASYDDEVDMYNNYLENVYNLCNMCQQRVVKHLQAQNSTLERAMDNSQLRLLECLKKIKEDRNVPQNNCQEMEEELIPKPLLPLVFFFLCTVTAFAYFIFNLRLYAASELATNSSVKPSFITRGMKSLVFTIPAQSALQGEEVAVYAGAAMCVCGLVAAGKYSLYPEDAVHLLLWLVSIVMTSGVLSPSLPWLQLTRSVAVCVSFVMMTVSIICCRRSRLPRHFTAVTIHKKHILQPNTSAKEFSDAAKHSHENKAQDEVEVRDKNKTSSDGKPSALDTDKDKGPQFENVRQDLESISLGLGRKSGSSSSIWSLPAIIASSSSDLTPDSSTDQATVSAHQPRSLVSPSRLGFINFDSRPPSRDSQSDSSRSPSPWSYLGTADSSLNMNQVVPQMRNTTFHPSAQASPPGVVKPVAMRTSPSVPASQHPSFRPPQYSSLLRGSSSSNQNYYRSNKEEDASGPCDSQTSGLESHENSSRFVNDMNRPDRFTYRDTTGGQQNWRSAGSASNQSPVFTGYRNGNDILISGQRPKEKDNVDEIHGNKTPRRSQRIAMIGRSPKPWSLKKSLSCNNAYDKENLEKAGVRSRSNQTLQNAFVANPSGHGPALSTLSESPENKSGLVNNEKYVGSRNWRVGDSKDVCGGNFSRRNVEGKHRMMEFSDDEDDNKNNTGNDKWLRRHKSNLNGHRNDVSWQWILIGVIIGISVTTNIFLTCQSWLAKNNNS